MGNDPYKYIHYNITNAHIKEVLDQNKMNSLNLIYNQFTHRTDFLSKENFNRILRIDDDKILDKIFDIFKSQKGKMFYTDFIYFYVSFTNEKFKNILLSFLIMGNHANVEKKLYLDGLADFINIDDNFKLLSDKMTIKQITKKEKQTGNFFSDFKFFGKKNEEEYISKELLIQFLEDQQKINKIKFFFYKEIKKSSDFFKQKRNKNQGYICNCLKDNLNNTEEILNKIKPYFLSDKLLSNGHLSFKNFEKLMKEYRVNEKLINLIIKYLKAYTMKDSINFNDFKEIISYIYDPKNITNKKNFLFKMILAFHNEKSTIKGTQLKKFFEIDNKECNIEEEIDLDKFQNLINNDILSKINEYINYMENLGFLPYIRYNLKTDDKQLQKKIINFMLNNKTAEEYLIENFDKYNKFYPINIEFWNSLTNKDDSSNEQSESELKINNSLIAEKDEIYYITKKEEEKKEIKEEDDYVLIEKSKETGGIKVQEIKAEKNEIKETKETKEVKEKKESIKGKLKKDIKYGVNYVIICGELYQKISQYFDFDVLIELEKTPIFFEPKKEEEKKQENNENIVKEKNEIKEEELPEEKLEINADENYLRKKENKNKKIKEYIVDFYPIKILKLNFQEVYKIVEKKFEELEKIKKENLSKSEKAKLEKEKNMKKKLRDNRIHEYHKKYEKIKELYQQNLLDLQMANEKLKILNEQFKDLEKKKDEIKVPKSEFFSILNNEIDNILSEKKYSIKTTSKLITTNEIKYDLINYYSNYVMNNFDLIYYTKENKYNTFGEKDSKSLEEINKDFILIIIDKKNEEGKTGLSILEENEKALNKTPEIINQESASDDTEIVSKEELKKLKEEQNEKERLKKEKERIEKEKLEKLERERKKAQEKLITPPYGIPNFGNTCYFNSVNQIILNLPIMQKLFSEKNIKYMINKENKFGFKGKLVSSFIPLYELYNYQISDYVKNLKSLVGKLKETFNNREQQDAHEYLNFILEGLHEELNLKSSKIYIEDNDDNYKYNNEEELGKIAWANNLRRNVSFIDSIFMFQLKSNLTCKKCKNKKFNFESSYVFDLPLSLCKMVTVHINLFRLPFKYKIYYDQINQKLKRYKEKKENENKNITEILCDFYSNELNFEQKKEQAVYVSFEFDFEREKCIKDLIKLIKNISLLELENNENNEINTDKEIDMKKIKIKNFTELIAYTSDNKKIIKNEVIIDKYVDMNDRVQFNIYEVLNTNGFCLINKNYLNNLEHNLLSYQFNKKGISSLKDFKEKIYFKKEIETPNESKENNPQKESDTTSDSTNNSSNNIIQEEKKINILSINDKLSYLDNFEKELQNNKKNNEIIYEFIIPIVHYRPDITGNWQTIFQQFSYYKMSDFPMQLLILNNSSSNKLSSKELYNYIWDYNSLYMTHPNKKTDKFWFNIEKSSENYKKCYPFVIRIVKKNTKFSYIYKCSKCNWFNFCPGCILSPDEINIQLDSDNIIFVDWCNSFIEEEIESQNFYYKKFSNEEITLCIESAAKNNNNNQYQSIQDCFDLFFVKENLEDPLSCRICGGPQNFIKDYEINKLPYVLILSLKRFKYNENNNFKLRQLITYPLYNFKLKEKNYNLFGVIYHYGSINSGHYTCAIRKEKRWIMCDDNRVYDLEEKRVMSSNAYILFYIADDSISNYSYYNCMSSLLKHLDIDKYKKMHNIDDPNFFEGEPVRVNLKGNGYVVEDYIEDFTNEDKKEENKDENEKNEENKGENNKKEGFVKIKFESIKEVQNVDKNKVERLILVDEQKKDN